jgi:integrase
LTLPPTVTKDLRAHRAAQAAERLAAGEVCTLGPDGGWVFATALGGPTDPRADARDFKELCKAAKVPARRLHDLRHSAATMMLANDLDLRTAGQVLGHSQVALTARYSHVLADRKSVAAARIEDAIQVARSERF